MHEDLEENNIDTSGSVTEETETASSVNPLIPSLPEIINSDGTIPGDIETPENVTPLGETNVPFETIDIGDIDLSEELSNSDISFIAQSIALNESDDEFVAYDEIGLFFPSLYEVRPGGALQIIGAGFTKKDNTVLIGDRRIENIDSSSGTFVSFTVPNDMPFGQHVLNVENANGTADQALFVLVVEDTDERPVVSGSSPENVLYGGTVTITGKNFTPEGNHIHTSYGIIENVASTDGITLQFQLLPFPEIPELQVGLNFDQVDAFVPFTFYVANQNGFSNEFGTVNLEL